MSFKDGTNFSKGEITSSKYGRAYSKIGKLSSKNGKEIAM